MYKIQQQKDIKFGSYYELELMKILKKLLNLDIIQYQDKYANHDFYINDDKEDIIGLIELKTRRIKFNDYPSLMMGYNKIIEGRRRCKEEGIKFVVYVWGFDDKYKGKKFYYWIETLDILGNQYYIEMTGNRQRGDNDKKMCMIYTKYLKPIDNLLEDLRCNNFI